MGQTLHDRSQVDVQYAWLIVINLIRSVNLTSWPANVEDVTPLD